MPHPILNLDAAELLPRPPGFAPTGAAAERYDARMAMLGRQLGARNLGYNLTVVPPGKRAFPFHSHRVNEEMFFILSGAGTLRFGAETYPVRAGDVICCPAGGPETAHQLVNTGTKELRYLAVSTTLSPEVAEYPDTGRFGLWSEGKTQDGKPRLMLFVGEESQSLDYWEGN